MADVFRHAVFLALIAGVFGLAARVEVQPAPSPVEVVVVAMFEPALARGDRPGEFQRWVEGSSSTVRCPLPRATATSA
jgi:purine nucleoside permease